MTVVVVSEHRVERTPDGAVWGETGYQFWARYLDVFDEVRLVCRLKSVSTPAKRMIRTNGPGVAVAAVPYYLGPAQYLAAFRRVGKSVKRSFVPGDAVILRVGSHLAGLMWRTLRRQAAPYGVEVVGDPYDVFGPGVIRHPARPLLRWWFTHELKRQCAAACGAAYVTERTLQRRYPCGAYAVGVSDVEMGPTAFARGGVLSTHYSSVELHAADFGDARHNTQSTREFRLITVGSMAQPYKGIDTAIRAVALCRRHGTAVRLTIVGDGRCRAMLEKLAADYGIGNHVRFTGHLPGPASVKQELDNADLFVLASLTEGLPRALIEAMARGLPCLASNVGGIPELLDTQDLIRPSNADELAAKITQISRDRARQSAMSHRNIERARAFAEEVLRARRLQFYRHVRLVTERWSATGRSQ